MKKIIGIITLTGNNNYGNRLQNYATEYIIKQMGLYPITLKNAYGINDRMKKSTYYYRRIRYALSDFKNRLKLFDKRLKCFRNFEKNINITKRLNTIYNVDKNKCDFYIVGSDQVWKPTYGRLSELDLLSFANPNQRISWAASFGIDELPKKYMKKVQSELLKFKCISVREDAGKKIVENLTNRKDVNVLIDPTMLLNSDEWDMVSVRPRQMNLINEKGYILNYFLGELDEVNKKIIYDFAKENNLEIINLLDKNDPFYKTGPSEFLYLEKNATLICTDSFHSSVFSIIYNKPFIVFDRNDKKDNMNSRIDTLLSKFNLQDRKFNGSLTNKQLVHDYSDTYTILEKEKNKNISFLKKAFDIEDSDLNDK